MNSTISGIYELCIGTDDLVADLHYWQQLGYRIGRTGALDGSTAYSLYGVDSALRSVRLLHGDADHGLVRLMAWESPTGPGLGAAPMRVLGGRWSATLTDALWTLVNHAEDAVEAHGDAVRYIPPVRQVIYEGAGERTPFIDPWIGVRETVFMGPRARHVFFQRFGYTVPNYGAISELAPLRTSQITHFGLIARGDAEQLDFYEETLGLLRARDGGVSSADSVGPANIFDLRPGERYFTTDFDDPRSSTDWQRARSGRLKIIRFDADVPLDDHMAAARPGALGPALYTYRVSDANAFHARLHGSNATELTDVQPNEFGEPTLCFTAPDGYAWSLVG